MGPSNSKRKLKRLKVSAGESIKLTEDLTVLLTRHGYNVSLPCDILPAVEALLGVAAPPAPASPRLGRAAPRSHAPAPAEVKEASDAAAPPMPLEQMQEAYRAKLDRTMEMAAQSGVTVDKSGRRQMKPIPKRPAPRPEHVEEIEEEEDDDEGPFEGFEQDDDTEVHSDQGGAPGPDDRVNPKTGKSLAEQRAIIERVTGKRPSTPEPGRVNPKALGG